MADNLGLYLKHLRESRGLTQTDVVRTLEISRNSLSEIEGNLRAITADRLALLLHICTASPEQRLEAMRLALSWRRGRRKVTPRQAADAPRRAA